MKPAGGGAEQARFASGMIRNRANPAHVKDILSHEDFTSLKSCLKLEIVDLKDAHRRFHPCEQDDGRNVDGRDPR